jgi:alpha-tubulin suppressor-like RCC1 family protein
MKNNLATSGDSFRSSGFHARPATARQIWTFATALALAALLTSAQEPQPPSPDDALVPTDSAPLILPAEPCVWTDRSDYPPGSNATIRGAGFSAGETVTLQVTHADGTPSTGADHEPWSTVADAEGAFETAWHVCTDDCLGATLTVTALGASSGLQAQAQFTDSATPAAPGTPLAWGYGFEGQLGDGILHTTTPFGSSVALVVNGVGSAVAVACGISHSLALKSDGTVRAWGQGHKGQLGNGLFLLSSTPVQVTGFTGGTDVSAGELFSLALKSDGTVWAWGEGAYGQLGNGATLNKGTPVQVSGLSGVVAVSAGGYHGLALKSDGTVWAWGYNPFGQLGDGTVVNRSLPVQVAGLSGVVAIAGGTYHSLAIKSDGTLWAWGNGGRGRLGNGSFQSANTAPIQVSGLTGVVAVDGGFEHSLAVKSDGTVWAWGRGIEGELGQGAFADSATPVQVSGLAGAVSVAAGAFHSLALKSDHTVRAWGSGFYGQLGNGIFYLAGPYGTSVPVQASSLPATEVIAAGYQHSLALRIDNQSPVAVCHNVNVSADANCSANASIDNGSYDPDAGDRIASMIQNPPGPYALGTTPVTLTVTDSHGASSSCQANVTVLDAIPPTVGCPAGTTVSADADCQAAIPNVLSGVNASDDCTPAGSLSFSQSPLPGTLVGLGTHTITVTVTDAAGNSTHCLTTVTVNDTTPPALTCPADISVAGGCDSAVPVSFAATAHRCVRRGPHAHLLAPARIEFPERHDDGHGHRDGCQRQCLRVQLHDHRGIRTGELRGHPGMRRSQPGALQLQWQLRVRLLPRQPANGRRQSRAGLPRGAWQHCARLAQGHHRQHDRVLQRRPHFHHPRLQRSNQQPREVDLQRRPEGEDVPALEGRPGIRRHPRPERARLARHGQLEHRQAGDALHPR